MSVANITPPTVNGSITYTTGKDADGVPIQYGVNVVGRRADAAVTRGQVCVYIAPGDTDPANSPLSVTPCADTDLGYQFAGVAVESAAAGDIVRLATDIGWCIAASSIAKNLDVQMAASGKVEDASTASSDVGAATSPIGYSLGAQIDDFFGSNIDAVLVKFIA